MDNILVISFVKETRVVMLRGEEVEATDLPGFDTSQQTLHCGNVRDDFILQVTGTSIRLISISRKQMTNEWSPEAKQEGAGISVVSCNSTQIVCAVRKTLYYLDITQDDIKEVKSTVMEYEIACLDINPLFGERSTLCAVGLWTDISVR